MVASQFYFFRERNYFAVWLTHFFIDVLNNGRNLLIAILAISLSLTNAQVGLVLLCYNIGNALCQPLFGYLADRIGVRWLIVGGMAWMIVFYTIAAVASDWVALITTTIASVGSGMFHPSGAKVASQIPESHRNRATAVFFFAGQLGLFFGPVLAGFFLDGFGRAGFLALPILALIALLSGWQWVTNQSPVFEQKTQITKTKSTKLNIWRRAILMIIIIFTSYSIGNTLITFLPKLFTEQNYNQSIVGLLSGSYVLGGVFGGLAGGYFGDHFSRKIVIAVSLLLSSFPLLFILDFSGWTQGFWLFLAGFLTTIPHSLLVIMAQSLFPNKKGMASGLVLGFMFFSGSLGSAILGYTADRIGLVNMLSNLWVLGLVAAITAFLIFEEPDGLYGKTTR
ncbi:MAG: MFS transporter [Chloroflexota bacterium]